MSRNRANIEQGQVAYVGDLRFGPGQLLPPGTVEYQVKGFAGLDAGEAAAAGVKGIPYSITVPVGTPKSVILDAVDAVVQLTLNDAYADYQHTDEQLGLDIFDELY